MFCTALLCTIYTYYTRIILFFVHCMQLPQRTLQRDNHLQFTQAFTLKHSQKGIFMFLAHHSSSLPAKHIWVMVAREWSGIDWFSPSFHSPNKHKREEEDSPSKETMLLPRWFRANLFNSSHSRKLHPRLEIEFAPHCAPSGKSGIKIKLCIVNSSEQIKPPPPIFHFRFSLSKKYFGYREEGEKGVTFLSLN